MDLIKDFFCTLIKFLTKNDAWRKTIQTNKKALNASIKTCRFIIALSGQARLSNRRHYKRIQRGSVKGVWFGENAASQTEQQLAQGSGPVILFMHGGAFISGQTKMWSDWAVDLFQEHKKKYNKDLKLFFVDYDLAPEARFPRQWHQSRAAHDYLTRTLDVEPARLFLSGDSAGGNLCLQTLFELESSKDLAGAILFSPWVFPAMSFVVSNLLTDESVKHAPAHSWFVNEENDYVTNNFGLEGIKSYLGPNLSYEKAYRSAQINPMLRTVEEISQLPDSLIIYGEGERLRDQIVEFVDKAEKSDLELDVLSSPGGVHDWPLNKALNKEKASYHKGLETVSGWIEKKMIHSA